MTSDQPPAEPLCVNSPQSRSSRTSDVHQPGLCSKGGGGLHGDITTIQQSQRYKRVESTGVPQIFICMCLL